ncbi:uncharacterized protein LOC135324856 [Dromaius novaehollandiae]|uniref:uncharacterized protein LOC135324856 n=1 Tax=Dromaius novaehollandiae TaxID=8790 RepID=UPI00311EA30B
MAERPPSRPRVAWQEQVEEAGVLAESSSQPQPHEGCVPQALLMAPSLALPREEAEALEHLHAFLSHRGKEEAEKLRFLASVCTLCTAASSNAWLREQLWLCRLELAETLEQSASGSGERKQQPAACLLLQRLLPASKGGCTEPECFPLLQDPGRHGQHAAGVGAQLPCLSAAGDADHPEGPAALHGVQASSCACEGRGADCQSGELFLAAAPS